MAASDKSICPVCEMTADYVGDRGHDVFRIECANCGKHSFDWEAYGFLSLRLADPDKRARLAYRLRQSRPGTIFTAKLLAQILKTATLPSAAECVDNVVLHLARSTQPGQTTTFKPQSMRATVGTQSEDGAAWALSQAAESGFVKTNTNGDAVTLILKGWQRFDELMRIAAGSEHAFMAMDFKQADILKLYEKHLRPAVKQTGYVLRKTNDGHKPAGSIDNRMRVELHTSRFVVCDLTHGNRGAYWEAGYAEALQRPVFYLCRRDIAEDITHEHHPHFDTAHQLIIRWNLADPRPAIEELKDAIRATLPGEALMEDPPARARAPSHK